MLQLLSLDINVPMKQVFVSQVQSVVQGFTKRNGHIGKEKKEKMQDVPA